LKDEKPYEGMQVVSGMSNKEIFKKGTLSKKGSRSIVWEIVKPAKGITWKRRGYYTQTGCFQMEQLMKNYTTRITK